MPVIHHIALVQFKPGVSQGQIEAIFAQLKSLKDRIPGILDFSSGRNNSHEGLTGGFTHGFIMTMQSAAARDAYLTHPEHEKVKAIALPKVENIVVFDYEA